MNRNNRLSVFVIFFSVSMVLTAAMAEGGGYPWKDHAQPYTFIFENHFDTHQQSQLKSNGELFGFFYITPTGDEINGTPVFEHCNANTLPESCEVGWILKGKQGHATFVYLSSDHPVWLVESRNDIPQPGAFSHFHWLGEPMTASELNQGGNYDGYFLELQALDKFYLRHGGEDVLVMPGIDISTHVNIVGSFPGF